MEFYFLLTFELNLSIFFFLFKKIFKMKKELHFAVEDIVLKNKNDIILIEDIFQIQKNFNNESFNSIMKKII